MSDLRIGTGSTTLKVHAFKRVWSNGYIRLCDYKWQHAYYQIANETDDLTAIDCPACRRHPTVKKALTLRPRSVGTQ